VALAPDLGASVAADRVAGGTPCGSAAAADDRRSREPRAPRATPSRTEAARRRASPGRSGAPGLRRRGTGVGLRAGAEERARLRSRVRDRRLLEHGRARCSTEPARRSAARGARGARSARRQQGRRGGFRGRRRATLPAHARPQRGASGGGVAVEQHALGAGLGPGPRAARGDQAAAAQAARRAGDPALDGRRGPRGARPDGGGRAGLERDPRVRDRSRNTDGRHRSRARRSGSGGRREAR
jgi:hypothetical protein